MKGKTKIKKKVNNTPPIYFLIYLIYKKVYLFLYFSHQIFNFLLTRYMCINKKLQNFNYIL